LVWSSNLSSIATSDIEERVGYVQKATNKLVIEIDESQEFSYNCTA